MNWASLIPLKNDGTSVSLKELVTFEPKNFSQRSQALYQNCFEIFLVLLSIVGALANPSLLAIGFILLTNNLSLTSFFAYKQRIYYGLLMHCFNLLLFLGWSGYKVWFLTQTAGKPITHAD